MSNDSTNTITGRDGGATQSRSGEDVSARVAQNNPDPTTGSVSALPRMVELRVAREPGGEMRRMMMPRDAITSLYDKAGPRCTISTLLPGMEVMEVGGSFDDLKLKIFG